MHASKLLDAVTLAPETKLDRDKKNLNMNSYMKEKKKTLNTSYA